MEIALALTGLLALCDWIAVATHNKKLEYVCKPGTLAALIAVALFIEPEAGAQRTWFVVALVLSLFGDVFLMLTPKVFLFGVASFFFGHIAYIVGFWQTDVSVAVFVVGVLGALVVGAFLARTILTSLRSGPNRELVGPVMAYMVAITLMLGSGIGSGEAAAIAGASLFYISDSLIAWNRFVRPIAWAPLAIIVTYHLGQLGLVLSL
ncbi:MAG TPA: lysoplasmalogenase [Actinomycetota bacterium]|nr:lysoplasmalogenase [Actinomycetota bacterium]